MGHERWFRGQHDGQGRPFDWRTAARQQGIPDQLARALYERAVQQAHGATQGRVQELYFGLLASARRDAARPSPGKVTRTMRLQAERAGEKRPRSSSSRLTGQPIAPGKRPLTAYIDPRQGPRQGPPHGVRHGPARERRDETRVSDELMRLAGTARPAFSPEVTPEPEESRTAMRLHEAVWSALSGDLDALDARDRELLADEYGIDVDVPRPDEADEADEDAAAQPLPEATRASMARAFGRSFDDIVVHPDSPRATGSIHAVTQGRDIHFARDRYAPGTAAGDWLLGHELAHVVQQTRGQVQASRAALEREADRAATDVMVGRQATISLQAGFGFAQAYSEDREQHDAPRPERQGPDGAQPETTPAADQDRAGDLNPPEVVEAQEPAVPAADQDRASEPTAQEPARGEEAVAQGGDQRGRDHEAAPAQDEAARESGQTVERDAAGRGRDQRSRTTATPAQRSGSGPIERGPTAMDEGSDGPSPAFQQLVQAAELRKQTATQSGEQAKGRIRADAVQQKQAMEQLFLDRLMHLEQARQQALDRIQQADDSARLAITSQRDVQIATTRQAAIQALGNLQQTVQARQLELRDVGERKAEAAIQAGEDEATRATNEASTKAEQARQAGQSALSDVRGEATDMGERAASDIERMGGDMAAQVRSDAQALADKFRGEAEQAALDFNQSNDTGAQEIARARDQAIADLETLAEGELAGVGTGGGDARAQVEDSYQQARTSLEDQRPGVVDAIDQVAESGCESIAEQTAGTVRTIDDWVARLGQEIGMYPGELSAENLARAEQELDQMVERHAGFLNDTAQSVSERFVGIRGQTEEQVNQAVDDASTGMGEVSGGYADQVAGHASDVVQRMAEGARHAGEAMAQTVVEADNRLGQAIGEADATWEQQLQDGIGQMRQKVSDGLGEADGALSDATSRIGDLEEEARSSSILDDVLSGIGSFFSGLWDAFTEFLSALWDALGVILIIVLVVLAIILVAALIVMWAGGLAFLAALALVLSTAWMIIQVVLAVVGIVFAIYAVIKLVVVAVTVLLDENMTWDQRMYAIGHAFFDVLLSVFDLILLIKLIGNLGKLIRLARSPALLLRLFREVGEVGALLRLLSKVNDVTELVRLLDRVGDVATLVRLLNKVENAAELSRLLNLIDAGKLAGVPQLLSLLDRVENGATLLRLLDKVSDATQLENLLDSSKIADAQQLLRLLENAKVSSASDLENLLGSSKITDAAQLENLLANAKIADAAQLGRLLDLDKVGDAASLQRLLDSSKIGSVADIERLLALDKVQDAAELGRLLDSSKLSDLAQLERLLALDKVADAAVLERLLALDKITDASQLETLLALDKIADAAQLERLLGLVDSAAQLQRLLLLDKITDAAQLERLMALVDQASRLGGLLAMADDAAQLENFLNLAGGASEAARLEELMRIAGGAGQASRLTDFMTLVNGNAAKFRELVEYTKILLGRTAPPAVSPPPAVSHFGFSGANMPHFLDGHTWEFLNIPLRLSKNSTTLWPRGTTASQISNSLDEALRLLNPPGTTPPRPLPGMPGKIMLSSGVEVQVGSQGSGMIGQFFPTDVNGFITIVKQEMNAIWNILRP